METQTQYKTLKRHLNERQWRIYVGTEALKFGYGGIARVQKESGSDTKTIRRGMKEVGEPSSTRIRNLGGGRKKLQVTDTTLIADLERLLEPKGDPMSLVRWTSKSLDNLVRALSGNKHTIKKSALYNLLVKKGFSLKANKKNIEGISHIDRDEQFKHDAEEIKFEVNEVKDNEE